MVLPIDIFKRDVSRNQTGALNKDYDLYNNPKTQAMMEHFFDEAVQKIGLDCIYMPRTFVNIDKVLGEDLYSKFEQYKMFKLKLYMPKVDTWGGNNELFKSTGIFIDDEAMFEMAVTRFGYEAQNQAGLIDLKPREGDLIKVVMSDDLFYIRFIEFENAAFYHRGSRYTYQFHCKKFTQNGEVFVADLNIPEVEDINTYNNIIEEQQGNQVIDETTKDQFDPIVDPNEDSIFGDF